MSENEIKKQVLERCRDMVTARIENIRKAMSDAQEASKSEERSTAGDKHDTARAMSHNIVEMNSRQLQEALRDLAVLDQINAGVTTEDVRTGSVVMTTTGNYFISVSAGEIKLTSGSYFAISPLSPIGQALSGKKQGESYTFRDKKGIVEKLFWHESNVYIPLQYLKKNNMYSSWSLLFRDYK